MAEIASRYVDLSVSDGTTMRAWHCAPEPDQSNAGLLVFQEAFGVNPHIRDVTCRFAKLGYSALAPELFHRTNPGFEGRYDDMASVMPITRQLTREGMAADVLASYEFLRERCGGNIACVGYCMGGRVSFLANTTVSLKAAISYYGGASDDWLDAAPNCSAPMLFYWGGKNKHIGPEQRQKVAAAMQASPQPSIDVLFSDADHGFFCDQRASYNPQAAQLSWALTVAFLEQHLGGAH